MSLALLAEQPIAPPVSWIGVGRRLMLQPFVLSQRCLASAVPCNCLNESPVGGDGILRIRVAMEGEHGQVDEIDRLRVWRRDSRHWDDGRESASAKTWQ